MTILRIALMVYTFLYVPSVTYNLYAGTGLTFSSSVTMSIVYPLFSLTNAIDALILKNYTQQDQYTTKIFTPLFRYRQPFDRSYSGGR